MLLLCVCVWEMDVNHNNSVAMVRKKKKKNGSIRSIFMHADIQDWFFMVFGLMGAIGDGLTTPLVLFITSRIMNNLGSFSNIEGGGFTHNINKVLPLFLFDYQLLKKK